MQCLSLRSPLLLLHSTNAAARLVELLLVGQWTGNEQ